MSKALKVVGTVVAVVALVASAVFTGGATLGIAASTVAAAGTVAAGAAIAAAALTLAQYAIGPPGFNQQGNPLKFTTNPQSGIPYGIGRTTMSGVRIHADTAQSVGVKVKNDILGFAVMLSGGGPIEEIETFKIDGRVQTFDANGQATGALANYMSMKVSLGLSTALALSLVGVSMPGWTSAHSLSGISHALWMLRYDKQGERLATAQVPEPEWIGKWVKVYDPRKDSTYPGGSGAHRAGIESTYEWSRNPALHALTWALGRFQNGKKTLGIGAPVGLIRIANFVEAANVADANGWTCGGFEYSTDSKWDILKRMLQAGGAIPTMTGAIIGCMVNTPRVPIATVSEHQLLDSLDLPTTKPRRGRFNTAIPRYASENHEWSVISGAPISVPEYVTMDGGLRSKEIDLPLVQDENVPEVDGNKQAGQIASYMIVNSREAGPINFTTGPAFMHLKTGDCINLDVPSEDFPMQPVIITSAALDAASGKVNFSAETETNSKHAFALGQTAIPPQPFSVEIPEDQPAPTDWVAEGLNEAGQVGIKITGTTDDTLATAVLLRMRITGETDWSISRSLTISDGEVTYPVLGLEDATSYDVEIAYKIGVETTEWVALGPVSTTIAESNFPRHEPTSAAINFVANSNGELDPPDQLPETLLVQRFAGSTDVSSDPGTVWSIVYTEGLTGGPVTVTDGVVNIPSGITISPGYALIRIQSVRGGLALLTNLTLTQANAPPNTDNADSNLSGVATTTLEQVSKTMKVMTGASGQLNFSGILSITGDKGEPTGEFGAVARWRYRETSVGTWNWAGLAIDDTTPLEISFTSDPPRYLRLPGQINVSRSQGGLTPNVEHEFELWAARDNAIGARTITFPGTVSGTGS